MIKYGIRTEVEVATKPVKENQEQIMKGHKSLMKKVGELEKKLQAIDKKREKKLSFQPCRSQKKTYRIVGRREQRLYP